MRRFLLMLAALVPVAGPAAPAARATLTLPIDAPFIEARVNGAPVRLRVAMAGAGMIVLTPAAARRLGLTSQAPSYYSIGPVTLVGGSRDVRLAVSGGEIVVRALWNDRAPYADPAAVDGAIGVGALPFATVRLMRADMPAGHIRTLRVRSSPAGGVESDLPATGITLRFAPDRPDTLATAAAGAMLARRYGGSPTIPAGEREILFGVSRPVAALTLQNPPSIGGLALPGLLVRTADYGMSSPERTAGDRDEIVVTGPGRTRPRLLMTIGADLLGRCAALEWRATARRIALDCP